MTPDPARFSTVVTTDWRNRVIVRREAWRQAALVTSGVERRIGCRRQ
jgi:hypothetical protein